MFLKVGQNRPIFVQVVGRGLKEHLLIIAHSSCVQRIALNAYIVLFKSITLRPKFAILKVIARMRETISNSTNLIQKRSQKFKKSIEKLQKPSNGSITDGKFGLKKKIKVTIHCKIL